MMGSIIMFKQTLINSFETICFLDHAWCRLCDALGDLVLFMIYLTLSANFIYFHFALPLYIRPYVCDFFLSHLQSKQKGIKNIEYILTSLTFHSHVWFCACYRSDAMWIFTQFCPGCLQFGLKIFQIRLRAFIMQIASLKSIFWSMKWSKFFVQITDLLCSIAVLKINFLIWSIFWSSWIEMINFLIIFNLSFMNHLSLFHLDLDHHFQFHFYW